MRPISIFWIISFWWIKGVEFWHSLKLKGKLEGLGSGKFVLTLFFIYFLSLFFTYFWPFCPLFDPILFIYLTLFEVLLVLSDRLNELEGYTSHYRSSQRRFWSNMTDSFWKSNTEEAWRLLKQYPIFPCLSNPDFLLHGLRRRHDPN